jgi:hypothetical protein
MTFVQQLNDNVVLLACTLFLLLFIGIRAAIVQGGWNRHLPYVWTLVIYSVYVFISPVYFYTHDVRVIIGTDVSRYFGLGFLFNNFAVLFFILGYWIKGRNSDKIWTGGAAAPLLHLHSFLCFFCNRSY